MTNFKHKYLIAIDGFTFIGRLPQFLSSGSLIFRIGMFSEWFDQWLKPYVHYLPVKLDFSDLESQLAWAVKHDKEARKIGERGQALARTRLRPEDMECYLYRLLLEYYALLESPQPETI